MSDSNIVAIIEKQISAWGKLGHPDIMSRFILKNGVECVPAPFTGERMPKQQCFKNAFDTVMMLGDVDYVEGYAMSSTLPLLIHHAWAIDDDGRVIDPTWGDPEVCQYYGVAFDFDTVCDEVMSNEVYGVLDPGMINIDFMTRYDPEFAQIVDSMKKGVPA